MNKIVTEKGHSVLVLEKEEMLSVSSVEQPVCDSCMELLTSPGYYIPLLHAIYCVQCFEEWVERAVFYEEDRVYEKHKLREIECRLKKGLK